MLPRLRWVCGACKGYEPADADRKLLRGWIANYLLLTLIGLWILAANGPGGGYLLIMQQAATLSGVAGIWLHEIGHALAAGAVGMKVWKLRVGRGPPKAAWRLGDVIVEIGRYPFLGGLAYFDQLERASRWRSAVAVAGGPAMNLLLAITVFGVAAAMLTPGSDQDWVGAGLAGLGLGQLLQFAINIWPSKSVDGHPDSDGRQLWTLLTARRSERDPYLEACFDSRILNNLGRFREARAVLERAWALRPQEPLALNLLLHVISADDGPDACLDFVRRHRAALDAVVAGDFESLPFMQVNIADAALRANPPDLDLAETFTDLACEAVPDSPAMLGTRGLLLARRGDPEAGRALLLQAVREPNEPGDQAQFCDLIAQLAQAAGNATEARAFDDIARRARRLSTGSGPA